MGPAKILPRYPVYIPSKGRSDSCYTARCLDRDGVPFRLVVVPAEREAYAARFGLDRLLVLPENVRGLVPTRNWIKDHAAAGSGRHWQLDDNLMWFLRRYEGKRIPCAAGVALAVCEDFTDRYTNVAISGLNYEMFLPNGSSHPPYYLNHRVYSCSLILNSTPFRWRGVYNDDTDMCLQVLAAGWCTVLMNAFLCHKLTTMKLPGGNTPIYTRADGRLKMSRELERRWPGVVTTKRRFRRPQHVVRDSWRKFDTPLILKPSGPVPEGVNEYGMKLTQVQEIKSRAIRSLLDQGAAESPGQTRA